MALYYCSFISLLLCLPIKNKFKFWRAFCSGRTSRPKKGRSEKTNQKNTQNAFFRWVGSSLRTAAQTHGFCSQAPPFWGLPLFPKAPPRQFQLPKRKLTPSKNQEWFRQTKPKKVRFANFRGRSPERVPEPTFDCKHYTKPLKKGVPELIPNSFPESLRTSLSSVWFAGATPEKRDSQPPISSFGIEFHSFGGWTCDGGAS